MIFVPSDLAGLEPGAELISVGGRVQQIDPLTVADAFAAVEVALRVPAQLEPGDLVLARGTLTAGRLAGATVRRLHRPWRAAAEAERLREGGRAAALALRARILRSVRRFFEGRGYLEVDTPAMVPSPGLDLHLDAFALDAAGGERPLFLSTSPEYQMKRLLSGGLPRIYQIAHCFRRGEIGSRHNPEFLMLEWYRAFATPEQLMDETEQLVRQIVLDHGSGRAGERRCDIAQPFARLSVCEAFARYAGLSRAAVLRLAATEETLFFQLWVERIEPALGAWDRPVFVLDFPATQASLARRKPDDPELCERFELYLGDLELCNGFGELCDPQEQRQRLQQDQRRRAALGKPIYPLDERFLAALEAGLPPAAGNALGLDRLIGLCAGAGDIADVQTFPIRWL